MARRKITEGSEIDASHLPDLTSSQLKFVEGILSGKTASDAYRASHPNSTMTGNSLWVEASRLRSNPNVALWLAEARKAHLGSAVLTKDQHLQELERLREIALKEGNIGAAVQAEQIRGKVAGHHIERIQDVTGEGDAIATLKQIEKISPDLAASLAAQHGIEWAKPEGETAH